MPAARIDGGAGMKSWQDNLRIVLVSSRNSLNIGAAARAMYNFGFSDLWCVRPYDRAFRAARSAAGAASVLRNACVAGDLAEAIADAELVVGSSGLEARKQRHVRRELPGGAIPIRTHLETRKAALLFGSEKFGLSNEDLSHCDWIVSIPTSDDCPSMNLGQAVAVCCYEIARHAAPQVRLQTPAGVSAGVRERILGMMLPILRSSGFLHANGAEEQTRKLRRLVSRLRLAPEDARMLQAILRQVDWKLRHPDVESASPD
ncbi:MAG: RNA methyltransferase [Bryobacterales bacterium]|nr:RNA methyltransferase [Bryobacterales bacterium]MDE0627012.1 RNA methyltransferase [Bryobacterales bacterium]